MGLPVIIPIISTLRGGWKYKVFGPAGKEEGEEVVEVVSGTRTWADTMEG